MVDKSKTPNSILISYNSSQTNQRDLINYASDSIDLVNPQTPSYGKSYENPQQGKTELLSKFEIYRGLYNAHRTILHLSNGHRYLFLSYAQALHVRGYLALHSLKKIHFATRHDDPPPCPRDPFPLAT